MNDIYDDLSNTSAETLAVMLVLMRYVKTSELYDYVAGIIITEKDESYINIVKSSSGFWKIRLMMKGSGEQEDREFVVDSKVLLPHDSSLKEIYAELDGGCFFGEAHESDDLSQG